MIVSMCRATPFTLWKKNIFFEVENVVKNKSKCGLSWSELLLTSSTRHYSFPKHFISYCFLMLSEFARVFERKVGRGQVAHLHNTSACSFMSEFVFPIVLLHDPVTWYGINYTGTQVTHWDFQNKGTRTSPARLSFVLKVPLRNSRPSVIYSVPCDRIVQRAYCQQI